MGNLTKGRQYSSFVLTLTDVGSIASIVGMILAIAGLVLSIVFRVKDVKKQRTKKSNRHLPRS